MTLYKRYIQFLSSHSRFFIFISLFYSVWLISRIYYGDQLELRDFDHRMIGQATVNGIDVGHRVGLFYQCALLFILFNIAVCFVALLLAMTGKGEKVFHFAEMKVLNMTSLAGLVIYFYKLFFPGVDSLFDLIYALHKVGLLLLVLKLFMWNDRTNKLFDVNLFSLLAVTGISCFFLVKETALILWGPEAKAGMFNVMSLVMLIGYSVVGFIVRHKDYNEAREKISRFFAVIWPLSFLPLISVIADEITMISHGSRTGIYFGLIGALALWVVYRGFRTQGSGFRLSRPSDTPTPRHPVTVSRYFGVLVVSLTSYLYYRPVIEPTGEMFEMANRALPIMEYYKFGTFPLIGKFNAHFLSDVFFGFIYTFFNGFKGQAFLIYDFMFPVLGALLSYWLVQKISGNPYVALFFVLCFPIGQLVVPEYFSFAIIGVLVLVWFLKQQPSLKSYIALSLSALFLIFWRLDIGYPVLFCYILVPLAFYLHKRREFFNGKILLKSLGAVFALALFLLLVLQLCGLPVFSALADNFSFLSASQAYGYSDTGASGDIVYRLHHFFFPLLVLLLLIFMLTKFKEFTRSARQRTLVIILLALAVLYIFNFQRGLVRHSFKENMDLFLSSFIYILLSGSVYLLLHKRSQLLKFTVFGAVATLLVLNYRLPADGAPAPILNYRYEYAPQMACVFQELKEKTDKFPLAKAVRDRAPESKKFKKEVYADFAAFTGKHLAGEETFIDFSNSPMLYFYTNKPTPSYFYHNPFHLCTDGLQKDFIAGLEQYKAPFTVYSHFPESWFDMLDGPHNSVKHYRVAEHLFRHYEPFAVVNNYCIWKKKGDERFKNSSRIVFRYDSSETEKISTDTVTGKTYFRSYVKINPGKKYLVKIKYRSESYRDLGFHFYNLPYSSTLRWVGPAFTDEYNNCSYYVIEPTKTGRFSYGVYDIKNISSLELSEHDLLPDLYSTTPRYFDLGKLPAIWAAYDDSATLQPVLAKLAARPEALCKGLQVQYKLPAVDRSSGNYIYVKLRSSNTSTIGMKVSYGAGDKIAGEYFFTIAPGQEEKTFVVRASMQYNWFAEENNTLSVEAYPSGGEKIELLELNILKAN